MEEHYNREYLELLAHKYKEGILTREEAAFFEQWYNSYADEQLELPEAYSANPIVIRKRIQASLTQKIAEDQAGSRRKAYRIPLLWQSGIAAAVVFTIFGAFLYNYLYRQPTTKTSPTTFTATHVAPGGNRATLTLANGSRIDLSSASIGTIAHQASTNISKTAEGQIVYRGAGTKDNDAQQQLNAITTPKGGQFMLMLPDGTKVWLNAASSLKYPTQFTGKLRTVELMGEAYFQVAHNKVMPFVVKTALQTVRVLGTHFNINSYADEGRTVTTLEEGSVMVEAGLKSKQLSPGNQAVLQANDQLRVQPANMETAMAWKNNKMIFEDAGIEEIMRQVARWYDIDIRYEGKVPDDTFSGALNRQSTLATVLKMFELTAIKFKVEQIGSRKTLIIKT
jgi:transmembrane sensor